eukprot:CAMPEP_0170498846 /NCGR_PEP_ID=MMETSP0208-20121228/29169_1 /TAXON_ID=197538 /ORGANISM="Strombidium inclinatum, Strain S3" /LENGTH=120 /DNA_ID=CAMNT_0010776151 /DNA_START=397 /DNA_END=755 /DNA_ORIENTATION=-
MVPALFDDLREAIFNSFNFLPELYDEWQAAMHRAYLRLNEILPLLKQEILEYIKETIEEVATLGGQVENYLMWASYEAGIYFDEAELLIIEYKDHPEIDWLKYELLVDVLLVLVDVILLA